MIDGTGGVMGCGRDGRKTKCTWCTTVAYRQWSQFFGRTEYSLVLLYIHDIMSSVPVAVPVPFPNPVFPPHPISLRSRFHLVRGVSEDELPLVLLQRARVPAYDLAAEVHLGADESQRRLQPCRGHGHAKTLGPVGWDTFKGQR